MAGPTPTQIELAKRAIVTTVAAQDTIIRRTATANVREYQAAGLSARLQWNGNDLDGNGASGSFTTVDGKTVTVVNGLITAIV